MPTLPCAGSHGLRADQQPDWADPLQLQRATEELERRPALVRQEDVDTLRHQLAEAAAGRALLLQGGHCAETFGSLPEMERTVGTLEGMTEVLSRVAGLPVITVGRVAGQYAKPRSRPTEVRDGVSLPVYRGDAVNGAGFTARERSPDPERLLRAYDESAAALHRIGRGGEKAACYSSHEALLLDYENALMRTDPRTNRTMAGSAHMLWIGERTRHVDRAHVQLAQRVNNPFAVKVGPSATADDLLELIARINPEHAPGKLTLITRLGADRINEILPRLVEKVRLCGAPVLWVCDPMHGNTRVTGAVKTRLVSDVMAEIGSFIEIHQQLGTHPGGLHLEITGNAVTECVGGAAGVREENLSENYTSACDPRLNRDQALEVASAAADRWALTPK
ncbi:3-deoxy-7-phosphoheptulonate synthase [Streptomonospora salina]|uniref:Phospho-2-dehydro-3-deoxyheptonate aldolase n=1 Tax=Streptomonospora salina TaxID=104205 RepID=A0A841EAJ7_9ACTN|nr:3-deoxy-7-phosphoheptulonate synthase [Streptomonospora salina]MBB6000026.1 3-deoxy-D-arabino-heptulosonate 7-phosphate (DAHP) synthase class II [Streptomonospora salina]